MYIIARGTASERESLRSVKKRNILIEQWIGLPYWVVGKWLSRRLDGKMAIANLGFDEAVQIATLTLIRCAERWNSKRGVKFKTYACQAMARSVLHKSRVGGIIHTPECGPFVEHARRARNILGEGCLKGEHTLVDRGGSESGARSIEITDWLGVLNARERFVVERSVLDGLPLRMIGMMLGVNHRPGRGKGGVITREGVRQIRARALAKLREHLAPMVAL